MTCGSSKSFFIGFKNWLLLLLLLLLLCCHFLPIILDPFPLHLHKSLHISIGFKSK